MIIEDIIKNIKNYCKGGVVLGQEIKPETTRDQILFHMNNDLQNDCTGIATTIYPSIKVIREAVKKNINLIICHEALFWNHGDHTEWLVNNRTYNLKKRLLEENHIVVWRCHDYVHSGIPVDGEYKDGIFWGFANEMGWKDYAIGDTSAMLDYELPETSASDLAQELIKKANVTGARIYGNPDNKVRKVSLMFHIFGDANKEIERLDSDEVDAFLGMELVDYSISEYVRDSSYLGRNKNIITIGHFNSEELGMKYMPTYLPEAIGSSDITCQFIQAGDMYNYVHPENTK